MNQKTCRQCMIDPADRDGFCSDHCATLFDEQLAAAPPWSPYPEPPPGVEVPPEPGMMSGLVVAGGVPLEIALAHLTGRPWRSFCHPRAPRR